CQLDLGPPRPAKPEAGALKTARRDVNAGHDVPSWLPEPKGIGLHFGTAGKEDGVMARKHHRRPAARAASQLTRKERSAEITLLPAQASEQWIVRIGEGIIERAHRRRDSLRCVRRAHLTSGEGRITRTFCHQVCGPSLNCSTRP